MSATEDDDGDELTTVELELKHIEDQIIQLKDRKEFLLTRKAKLKDDALLRKSHSLANRNWNRTDFTWSKKVEEIRESVFKLPQFREHQLATINAVLSKEDAILLMPTGGGKSLCYQLPSIIFKGLTLVISPLLALMEDQIMSLKALNIDAALLSANSTKEEVNRIQQAMISKDSTLKLLYVTPEKLAKSKRFMSKVQKCYQVDNLRLIAIDEVHCCSQWGHDFRPDYKYLGVLKAMFPDVPMLGVTATATTRVLVDVQKMLYIQGCLVIKAHFNRPNLFYEVREKSSNNKECIDELAKLLTTRFAKQSGIIYTTTVKDCDELTRELQSCGIKVACYHAQLDAHERRKAHVDWLNGTVQAVIATIAFGLGIDKPDVRFVIHHALSKSMENYYQESGRAGRDNKQADCVMFYRLADVFKLSSMVYAQQVAIEKLYYIIGYCLDQTRCRREMIASQFEEPWESQDCLSMCDHCRQPREEKQRDVTQYCRGLYSMIKQALTIKKKVTAQMLLEAWFERGPSELRVNTVKRPPLSREAAEDVIAFLLINGYLKEDYQLTAYKTNTYLKIGMRAGSVSSGKHTIQMTVRGRCLPSIIAGEKLEPSSAKEACKLKVNEKDVPSKQGSSTHDVKRKIETAGIDIAANENPKAGKRVRNVEAIETKVSAKRTSSAKKVTSRKQEKSLVESDAKARTFSLLTFTANKLKMKSSKVDEQQVIDLCDDKSEIKLKPSEVVIIEDLCSDSDDDFLDFKKKSFKRIIPVSKCNSTSSKAADTENEKEVISS